MQAGFRQAHAMQSPMFGWQKINGPEREYVWLPAWTISMNKLIHEAVFVVLAWM